MNNHMIIKLQTFEEAIITFFKSFINIISNTSMVFCGSKKQSFINCHIVTCFYRFKKKKLAWPVSEWQSRQESLTEREGPVQLTSLQN